MFSVIMWCILFPPSCSCFIFRLIVELSQGRYLQTHFEVSVHEQIYFKTLAVVGFEPCLLEQVTITNALDHSATLPAWRNDSSDQQYNTCCRSVNTTFSVTIQYKHYLLTDRDISEIIAPDSNFVPIIPRVTLVNMLMRGLISGTQVPCSVIGSTLDALLKVHETPQQGTSVTLINPHISMFTSQRNLARVLI